MPILTTTIGAYPKPGYVPIPDWFGEESTTAKNPTQALDDCLECRAPEIDELLDRAHIDAVSLEDAHRPNDLSLLELFEQSIVILGVIGIARSRIESVEEIRSRITRALDHIDAHRLMAAPDCGLGMLSREQVAAKLGNMVAAARLTGN